MNQPARPRSVPRSSRAQGLVKYYPDGHVQALRGVSLEIKEAESVAITGPSGCGKSTLLHILGGLDRPTEGEVFFRGTALSKLDIDAFRARQVGFVFQTFYLMPTLNALENIQIPMFEAPWTPRRARRARRAADRGGRFGRPQLAPPRAAFHRPAPAHRHRPRLGNDPCLLLADEPTGNLDSKSQDEIIQLLHRLRDSRRLTLVIVTHSHEVAAAADRRIQMKDGQVQDGS